MVAAPALFLLSLLPFLVASSPLKQHIPHAQRYTRSSPDVPGRLIHLSRKRQVLSGLLGSDSDQSDDSKSGAVPSGPNPLSSSGSSSGTPTSSQSTGGTSTASNPASSSLVSTGLLTAPASTESGVLGLLSAPVASVTAIPLAPTSLVTTGLLTAPSVATPSSSGSDSLSSPTATPSGLVSVASVIGGTSTTVVVVDASAAPAATPTQDAPADAGGESEPSRSTSIKIVTASGSPDASASTTPETNSDDTSGAVRISGMSVVGSLGAALVAGLVLLA